MSKSIINKPQTRPLLKLDVDLTRYTTVIALIGVTILFSLMTPSFFTATNVANILSQSAILALVAIGLSFVVASGGIDLSIAVSYDLGAMVAIMVLQAGMGWIPAILLGLLAGALVGLFNGFFVVRLNVTPFLVTLGTMFIGESVQKIFTKGGEPIFLPGMDEMFKFLGRASALLIYTADGGRIDFKFSIVLALVVTVIAYFVLNRTIFGRHLFALGSQKEAAYLSGVPVKRYTVYAFVICGVICAFAGMVGSSVLAAYTPLSGKYYLMDAIGAVFIGSTLSRQGRANIPGTLVGVLFFGIVANGLNLAGINFYWQAVARGVLIFLILGLDSYMAGRRK
jgi:ribose transport system permease protein